MTPATDPGAAVPQDLLRHPAFQGLPLDAGRRIRAASRNAVTETWWQSRHGNEFPGTEERMTMMRLDGKVTLKSWPPA
jgi:hypothetical protein